MKITKIVGIIVLLLLLKTKAYAIGAFDTTTTGICLTKGTLMIPELGNLYNQGAISQSEAICFGNDNPADDLTIRIEGNLQLLAGRLMYENAE
jgi:hypothetical protein